MIDSHPVGSVIWSAVGRFYEAADKTLQDLGYFVYLGGVEGSLFEHGHPHEAEAFFTFRSTPLRIHKIENGEDLWVSLDTTGSFTVYYNPKPCGNFAHPETFSQGQPIATFSRLHTAVGTTVGSMGTNVFTAALRTSADFSFHGKTCNLKHLVPHGITQFGTSSSLALTAPPGFTQVTAFAGTAIVLGGNVRAH